MKTLRLEDISGAFEDCLKTTNGEDFVLTINNKVAAIVQPADEDDVEEYLLVHDPRFIEMMAARRRRFEKEGGVSQDEIDRMIQSMPD